MKSSKYLESIFWTTTLYATQLRGGDSSPVLIDCSIDKTGVLLAASLSGLASFSEFVRVICRQFPLSADSQDAELLRLYVPACSGISAVQQ